MKYRTTEILGRTDLGEAGTKTVDIKLLDPISRIEIGWEILNWSAKMTAQLGSAITKLELVDGSEVLFSLSGLECQALNIYDRKCPSMNGHFANAGAYMYAAFAIDFGRYLYDPELAFDPKRFRNPQLKITFDEDAFMETTGTNYMEIFAHVFDEMEISPIGFLMSKKHHSYYADNADAYTYIDLPTDHPIRQLLIRGFHSKIAPTTVVDEARLSEDNDKRVIFDLNLERYAKRMSGVWTPVVEFWNEYSGITSQDYDLFFTPTGFGTFATWMPRNTGNYIYAPSSVLGGYLGWQTSGASFCDGMITGFLPNHCYSIPFGLPGEIDSWYDVTKKGSVVLRLLSAEDYGSDTEIGTILQQLRRY